MHSLPPVTTTSGINLQANSSTAFPPLGAGRPSVLPGVNTSVPAPTNIRALQRQGREESPGHESDNEDSALPIDESSARQSKRQKISRGVKEATAQMARLGHSREPGSKIEVSDSEDEAKSGPAPGPAPPQNPQPQDDTMDVSMDDANIKWVLKKEFTKDMDADTVNLIQDNYEPALHNVDLIAEKTKDHFKIDDVLRLRTMVEEGMVSDSPQFDDVHRVVNNNKGFKVHVAVRYASPMSKDIHWLGEGAAGDASTVKAYFTLASQTPCVTLRTPRLPGLTLNATDRPASIHIHARNISFVDPKSEFEGLDMSLLGREAMDKLLEGAPEKAKEQYKTPNAFALRIAIKPTARDPIAHRGLTMVEAEILAGDCAVASDSATRHRDLLALTAFNGVEVVVFGRTLHSLEGDAAGPIFKNDADIFNAWFQYLKKLMTLNALEDSFWWYKQSGAQRPDESFKVPRFLAQQWQWEEATVDKVKKIRNIEVLSWGQVNRIDAYPNHQTMFVANCLAVQRQKDYQTAMLRKFVQTKEALKLDAEFVKLHGEGRFVVWAVFIYLLDAETFSENDVPMPVPDTRMSVCVQKPGDTGTYEFSGTVQPNKARPNASFALVMRGPPKVRDDFDKPGNRYEAWVSAIDDSAPSKRRLDALVRMIALPGKVPAGADFAGLIQQQDFRGHDTNELAKQMAEGSEARKKFDAVINVTPLNEEQTSFARGTANSSTGIDLLHGPPGTGKTHTVATTVAAHVNAGNCVLFTSDQNGPVQEGLRKFKEIVRDNSRCDNIEPHQYVHFNGAASTISTAMALNARIEGRLRNPIKLTEQAEDETPEQKEERLGRQALEEMYRVFQESEANSTEKEDSFGFKLYQRIAVYEKRGTQCLERQTADQYMAAKRALLTATPQERSDISNTINRLEKWLALWYLTNEVRAVFCTLSMSSHEVLVRGFKPKILVVDEAAHASMTDIIIPIVGFAKFPAQSEEDTIEGSLLTMIMCGDDKQSKPVSLGEKQNEFHDLVNVNLFKQLRMAQTGSHCLHTLVRCYRMLPQLLEYPSMKFYNKQLTSDPSVVTKELALQATIKDFHRKKFGRQFNNRPRLALDVSGDDVHQIQYRGSTSRANPHEVETTIAYCEELLTHEAPLGGRQINVDDLLIITCYTGQAKMLREELVNRNSIARNVRILTTDQVQGGEANIVIFSFVISMEGMAYPEAKNKLPIRFIADSGKVCVNLTRAKFQLTLIGDLTCFAQCDEGQHMGLKSKKAFQGLIQDLRNKKDIIPVSAWKSRNDAAIVTQYQRNTFSEGLIPFPVLDLRNEEEKKKRPRPESQGATRGNLGQVQRGNPFTRGQRGQQQHIRGWAGSGRGAGEARSW
jgi:superfamily I DNA and/or RNA helicase